MRGLPSKTSHHISIPAQKIPLRFLIVAPFVVQIVAIVGLIEYLSFRNGQQAVNELATRLMQEVSSRIEQKLSSYLETPHSINQLNVDAIGRGELNLNLNQYNQRAERYLWQKLRLYQSIQWISLGSQTGGEYLGVWRNPRDKSLQIVVTNGQTKSRNTYFSTTNNGVRVKQIKVEPGLYDARTRPWYKEAVVADKPIWTSIYPGFTPGTVFLSTSQSIRDATGKLLGVTAVDISLDNIQQFLTKIEPSPGGKVFIVERSGLLVASSSQEPLFKIITGQPVQLRSCTNCNKLEAEPPNPRSQVEPGNENNENSGLLPLIETGARSQVQRLNVLDSQTPLIQTTARYLKRHGGFKHIYKRQQLRFRDNQQQYFVEVVPFKDRYGLDWLITIVVPEADFMAQIHQNTATTLLLCGVALIIATGAGILTARWVTLPLKRLNQAAQEISKGDFDRPVAIHWMQEVGDLAKSFNDMAAQLKTSFKAVQESEEKFVKLLESLPVGVSAIAPNGNVIYTNSVGMQILGKTTIPQTRKDNLVEVYQIYLVGTNQLYPLAQLPSMRALNGEYAIAEDLELRRDDKIIPLAVQSIPVFDETGKIIYAINVFQNISQRKQAETALRQSEQRYAALAKAAPVGIFRNDIYGNCLYGNERSFEMIGLSQAEAMGRGWTKNLHPDDRERAIETWYQAVQQNQPFVCEYRFQRQDKTVWVYGQAVPEKDAEGNIIGYVGTITDISERQAALRERKQAEAALKQSETFLRLVMNNAPAILWALDRNGIFTLSEGKGLEGLGIKPGEVVGMSIFDLYGFLPEVTAAIRQTLTTGEPYQVTAEANGRTLQGMGNAFYDDRGNILGMIGVSMDITSLKQAEQVLADYNRTLEQQVRDRTNELEKQVVERQRAEEAAQAASRAKSAFLANMSHELRTPLNAILGFSQLMGRSTNLSSDQQENLEIIRRSGEHLLMLINQVLDLSKIEAGQMTVNPENFDLHRFLTDLENILELRANKKGLQLDFDRAPDVPKYICTDEVKLRQILMNLLGNGIKFTETGKVSCVVSQGELNNSLNFEITDTGVGISADEIESLFQPFVQTSAGRQVREGTGLGLSISRQFIKLLGGEIEVKSQVAMGTTFKFNILVDIVSAPEIKSQLMKRVAIALAPQQPNYRILIVDDNSDNRQLLFNLLFPLGLELQVACNGEQAVSIWETWQPHLIWMDLQMPVMDGYEATRKIKAQSLNSLLVPIVIAITATAFAAEKAAALSAGCDDFIRKPFCEEQILTALEIYLGLRYVYNNFDEDLSDQILANSLETKAESKLDPQWVNTMQQAIRRADLSLVSAAIAEIQPENPVFAQQLQIHLNNFDYQQILKIIAANQELTIADESNAKPPR